MSPPAASAFQGAGQWSDALAAAERARALAEGGGASEELLANVEAMLAAYQADGRPLRVEVVSHSEGLDLLRERLSQHQAEIRRLAGKYSNLTFVACQNTIDRLKVEHGIEVKLVPDAEIIDSGVSHVVKRQKEGWSYIRV